MRTHWIALALLLACTSTVRGPGEQCVFNGDCVEGLVCAGRRCRMACRTSRDCAAGTRCTGANDGLHGCVPDAEPGTCRLSSDCAEGEVCQAGSCLKVCRADPDCPSALRCSHQRCVPPWLQAPADDVPAPADLPDAAADAPAADLPTPPDVAADAGAPADVFNDLGGDVLNDVLNDVANDLPRDAGAADAGAPSARVVEICASGDRTCARGANGRVWCWGSNVGTALGAPATVPSSAVPREVPGVAGATLLACGSTSFINSTQLAGHACVRAADGRLACWGNDRYGQSAGPSGGTVVEPAARAFPEPVGALALGPSSTLVMTASGALWGFGLDDDAVLLAGDGTRSAVTTPVRSTIREPVVLAALGTRHACALTATGRLFCAGSNAFGEWGTSIATDAMVPVEIEAARPIGRDIVSMVAGMSQGLLAGGFTCVATRDGVTRCTGTLSFLPSGTRAFTPVEGLRGALRLYANVHLRTAGSWVCALRDDLTVRCLHARSASVPAMDLPFTDVHDFALGNNHFCALHPDGTVDCMGANDLGQLGTGDTTSSMTPRRVVFPAPDAG